MARAQCRQAATATATPTATRRRRSTKTKTTVSLDALPQGLVDSDIPAASEQQQYEGPSYPTVVLQARNNMIKFKDCVVLTRVGGFYELYFDQADEFGPRLNLKVAQKKTSAGLVSMAGFPFFQLDRYLKILVQDFKKHVAIAEEFPNDPEAKVKSGGLLHDRRVARIVTPGTLIDENFLDPDSSNFVLAIQPYDKTGTQTSQSCARLQLGLAWTDLSTGQFYTEVSTLAELPRAVSRISPVEVVLHEGLPAGWKDELLAVLSQDQRPITYAEADITLSLDSWTELLGKKVVVPWIQSQEIAAGNLLLQFVSSRLQESALRLQPPLRFTAQDIMMIDRNTARGLELRETLKDGLATGSLFHTLRRTVTKGGARLLRHRLSAPSTDQIEIESRLEMVQRFVVNPQLREALGNQLKRLPDVQRLLQRFALGRATSDDLLAIATTLKVSYEIRDLLYEASCSGGQFRNAFCQITLAPLENTMGSLADKILAGIDEDALMEQHRQEDIEAQEVAAFADQVTATAPGSGGDDTASRNPESTTTTSTPRAPRPPQTSLRQHYGLDTRPWIMRPKASPLLARLHKELTALETQKVELESQLQTSLGLPSLTLKWTPSLGHICHIRGRDAAKRSSSTAFQSLTSTRSTLSFHSQEWSALGLKIDQARLRIRAEEQAIFTHLRNQVIRHISVLRETATILDTLDVTYGFAVLAAEKSLVCPIINDYTSHKIVGGRHITVESGLQTAGRTFTSNNCFVGSPDKTWVITGPNMGGKSTFLRQNALITIMAQAGSFVPAEYAEIGIVDQIFSRIGSADDLYRDQSTFMVEMMETATILKHATPKSFVIVDEIGRGTTPEDGTAIAFACLHHLTTVNKCRTLFATHFHKVADLAEEHGMNSIAYWHTDIIDSTGSFTYKHTLSEGINKKSHALKVAKMAGIPTKAIKVAKEVLAGKTVEI